MPYQIALDLTEVSSPVPSMSRGFDDFNMAETLDHEPAKSATIGAGGIMVGSGQGAQTVPHGAPRCMRDEGHGGELLLNQNLREEQPVLRRFPSF